MLSTTTIHIDWHASGCHVRLNDRSWSLAPLDVCSTEQHNLLRWYFEDYAEHDPLQTGRAQEAARTLVEYGTTLFDLLELKEYSSELAGRNVVVEISQLPGAMENTPAILWEVLERSEAWPQLMSPSTVTVLRSFVSRHRQDRSPDLKDQFRILILTARPQGQQDVPHRFVSNIIVNVASRMRLLNSSSTVHIEIARPGTFQALAAHLSSRRGFFHLVHFDVHGVEMNDKMFLTFIRPTMDGFGPDFVSAKIVGDLLASNGVKAVVLNACRSAAGSGIDSNIAVELLACGLDWVVAMSYKIGSAALSVFLEEFYEHLWIRRVAFHEATRLARLALMTNPMKNTKIGFQVEVFDSVVPLCFKEQSASQFCWKGDLNKKYGPSNSDHTQDHQDLITGRENDILLLENNLLLRCRIGILTGPPSIGKTLLLKYLTAWWYATHLVDQTIYFDVLQDDMVIDLEDTIKTLIRFDPAGDVKLEDSLVRYFKQKKYLVVFDSLDAWSRIETRDETCERRFLKKVLRCLSRTPSLVVILSRKAETWLQELKLPGQDQRIFIQPLSGLQTPQGVQLAFQLLRTSRDVYLDEEDDTPRFVEAVVKLVQGNPLALRILLHDYSLSSLSLEDYYQSILRGKSIDMNGFTDATIISARGVRELHKYLYDCVHPSSEIREAQHRLTMAKIMKGIPLTAGDFVHAVSPSFLALFWDAISVDGVWRFFMLYSAETQQDLVGNGLIRTANADELELVRWLQAFNPDVMSGIFDLPEIREHTDAIRELFDKTIQWLLDYSFFEIIHPGTLGTPALACYRIHPLLPIMSRTADDYPMFGKHLQNSILYYFGSLWISWPTDFMYWNPVWDEAKKQAGVFFHSIYAALTLASCKPGGNILNEMLILMSLMALHKGLFADTNRYLLVVKTWQMLFERGIRQVLDAPDAVSGHLIGLLVNKIFTPNTTTHVVNSAGQVWFLKYVTTSIIACCGNGIVASIAGVSSETKEDIRIQAVRALKDYLQYCHSLEEQEKPVFINFSQTVEDMEYFLKQFEVNNTGSLDAFWPFRQQWIRSHIRARGVEEVPTDQASFDDLPRSLNSLTVTYASVLDISSRAKALIQKGDINTARQVLMGCLEDEINYGSNQTYSKHIIYSLLVDVEEKDENWLDAIENLNRAWYLEDSRGDQVSKLEMISREGRLARLYEKAGDLTTTRNYIRALLRRANSAHSRDGDMEISALFKICELEYAERLDGDVSSIFLLTRAAKVAYRHGVSQNVMSTGWWLTKFMAITNNSQPLWMFGATDPRPQTIAIAFWLSTFGNGIIFPLCVFAIQAGCWTLPNGPDNSPESRRLQMPVLELEQRLFSEDDAVVRFEYFNQNMGFENKRRLFEHLYVCGDEYLHNKLPRNERGALQFPPAPWTPATLIGTTASGGLCPGTVETPNDYICPTEIMLRLAGFIVDDGDL